jgi:hypothetical protein
VFEVALVGVSSALGLMMRGAGDRTCLPPVRYGAELSVLRSTVAWVDRLVGHCRLAPTMLS